ncbi:MAG: glycosyltransferase family 4 protein [Eubacteriales bacterium]|nr:glycosyltransferase family 4 protein [Eubacteriales bacterium]
MDLPEKTASNGAHTFHIAMLGHKRIPTREGGVEIVVRELAVRMAAMGNRVEVLNRWDLFTKGGRVGQRYYQGVRIRQIPTLRNSKVNAFIYSVLASIRVLFGDYDVIHYHAIGSCAMLWLPHWFGKKTVVTVHGLDWKRAKWNGFATRYLKLGEAVAAKYADEIIVLCKDNQQYFLETYGRTTTLLPNGVDKCTLAEADLITAEYGLSKGDYLLYLARIVPEKGLHYLIEAFQTLHTDKKLIIAGNMDANDPYCQKVRAMAANDRRIQFVGLVRGRLWQELFSNCCLYILPSDIEGMPMSLLEALSFGCRCLVSDISENIEAGQGCVSLFKHGDVADLAKKMDSLISRPEEGRITKANAVWEDWDVVSRKTLEIYQRVVAVPKNAADHEAIDGRSQRRSKDMDDKDTEKPIQPATVLAFLLPVIGAAYMLARPSFTSLHWCALFGGTVVTFLTYLFGRKIGLIAAVASIVAGAAVTVGFWPELARGMVFWGIWLLCDAVIIGGVKENRKRLLARLALCYEEMARTEMTDKITQTRNLHAFLNDTPIYMKIAKRYQLTLVLVTVGIRNVDQVRKSMHEDDYNALLEITSSTLRDSIRLNDMTYFVDKDKGMWCINMFTNAESINVVFDRLRTRLITVEFPFWTDNCVFPEYVRGYTCCPPDGEATPKDLLKTASADLERF